MRSPNKTFLTPDEAECENHFKETCFKIDGRFGVRLPFKSPPSFPGSREIATKSFTRLESPLSRNQDLKLAYNKFMQEYLDLQHMELVPPEEIDRDDVYYIPHHAVFHNENIRVVFNASMPSYNGQSLNDTLHSGPKLQQDIVLVLIKWRCFKYVFTCDIIKMF